TVLPAKLEMDLEYCSNVRFFSDLKIILATAACLLMPKKFGPRLGQNPGSSQNEPASQKAQGLFTTIFYSRGMQFVVDVAIFATSLVAAYIIRFEGLPNGFNLTQLALWLPVLVALRLAVHYWSDTYRLIWRFVSLADAVEIAKSIAIVTALVAAIRLIVP